MDILKMSAQQQEKYLVEKIFEVLKEYSRAMSRAEIKEALSDRNDSIAKFIKYERVSKQTQNSYHPFLFKFNFAIKNLIIAGLVENNGKIALTEKGINLNLANFDVEKDVYSISDQYWKDKHKEYQAEKKQEETGDTTKLEESSAQEIYNENLKVKLLDAIAKMSPGKFEAFSRALLKEMGVNFTGKGVNISNDGGIDGFGYHRDSNDFRTTRVVIQCKRYNTNDVSSPEIDRFLGAMNKNQADYGIFITNSRFTVSARKAAVEGSPITLIDGDELVRLIIKYELFLEPVQTYELNDFYKNEENEA
ncbi:MAG: Mrr restriction system protein [Candidatus Saccharibacteria bacterium]|nr:Mrr restriction system protein [Candidatus Saccharibacteria bacterium]